MKLEKRTRASLMIIHRFFLLITLIFIEINIHLYYCSTKCCLRQRNICCCTCSSLFSSCPPHSPPGLAASEPVRSPVPLFPDQCSLQGHRHCCKVHWCWCCHSGRGRIRSWNRNSVRQPYHRLC